MAIPWARPIDSAKHGMYRTLNDLRILRLAQQMEETVERYELSLRNDIPYVPVRARLAPLFSPGPSHLELHAAVEDLARQALEESSQQDPESVLTTLLECEIAAREFYLTYLDRLSDPRLVELFRRLADEEYGHIRAVEAARDLLHHRPRSRPAFTSP